MIEFDNDRILTMANSHNHLFHQFCQDGYLLIENFLSVIDLDPIIEDIQEHIENTLKRKRLSSEKTTTPTLILKNDCTGSKIKLKTVFLSGNP